MPVIFLRSGSRFYQKRSITAGFLINPTLSLIIIMTWHVCATVNGCDDDNSLFTESGEGQGQENKIMHVRFYQL